jgi:pimeloyl-ACP methyl ester carboxylesterase
MNEALGPASDLLGRALRPLEGALGAAWSLGEIAQAFLRPGDLLHDREREAVLADVARRGFYPTFDVDEVALREEAGGWLHGKNPHRRLSGQGSDRVVAHLSRATQGEARQLVVICHCYGIPAPRLMRALFGVDRSPDADVVTNIMAHHYAGSFRGWPGAGFTSAHVSAFIENLRTAVSGLRALTAALAARHRYERISVFGFSLGGQLALHLANTGLVQRALLYCPAVSMHASATELGLMGALHAPVRRLLARTGSRFSFDDLRVTEPLGYPLGIAPRDLHVVVQRHDALAPVRQVEAIRARYPDVRWYELGGTHLYPAQRARLHAIAHAVLA